MLIITYIPSCTTPEDYAAWKEISPSADARFCNDCTPSFKREMVEKGRCDYPDTKFERDEDGKVTGTLKIRIGVSLDLFSN
jgi:hypothetical protein